MGLEKYLKGKTLTVSVDLNISFSLLRKQKAQLIETIEKTKPIKEKELLTGILHLIDGIQDAACKGDMVLTELHVFGKK